MAGRRRQKAISPGEAVSERVRTRRTDRGWTQQRLAERMTELGHPTSQVTVAKIEKGETRARNITLHEALVMAVALDLSPLSLLAGDTEPSIAFGALRVTPERLRRWFTGQEQLPGQDSQRFVEGNRWLRRLQAAEDNQRRRDVLQGVESLIDHPEVDPYMRGAIRGFLTGALAPTRDEPIVMANFDLKGDG